VFREVALAALRTLDVPQDLPGSVLVSSNAPVESDLAIAGIDKAPTREMLRPERMEVLPQVRDEGVDPFEVNSIPVSVSARRPSKDSGQVETGAVTSAVSQPEQAVSSVTLPPVSTGDRRPFLEPGGAATDATVATAAGPRTPDFRGMTVRAVLESATAAGVPVEVQGSGVAQSQDPPAGAALPRRSPVRVQFSR
jgi:hypothetical protein